MSFLLDVGPLQYPTITLSRPQASARWARGEGSEIRAFGSLVRGSPNSIYAARLTAQVAVFGFNRRVHRLRAGAEEMAEALQWPRQQPLAGKTKAKDPRWMLRPQRGPAIGK